MGVSCVWNPPVKKLSLLSSCRAGRYLSKNPPMALFWFAWLYACKPAEMACVEADPRLVRVAEQPAPGILDPVVRVVEQAGKGIATRLPHDPPVVVVEPGRELISVPRVRSEVLDPFGWVVVERQPFRPPQDLRLERLGSGEHRRHGELDEVPGSSERVGEVQDDPRRPVDVRHPRVRLEAHESPNGVLDPRDSVVAHRIDEVAHRGDRVGDVGPERRSSPNGPVDLPRLRGGEVAVLLKVLRRELAQV